MPPSTGGRRRLAAGATGWLGSTAGVTEDGTFLATARFESRTRRARGWRATRAGPLVVGDVAGSSRQAHVPRQQRGRRGHAGRSGPGRLRAGHPGPHQRSPTQAREVMNEGPDDWSSFRPDMLGSLGVGHDEGAYTVVLYFVEEGPRGAQGAAGRAQGPDGRNGRARSPASPQPRSAASSLAPLNRTRTVRMDYVGVPAIPPREQVIGREASRPFPRRTVSTLRLVIGTAITAAALVLVGHRRLLHPSTASHTCGAPPRLPTPAPTRPIRPRRRPPAAAISGVIPITIGGNVPRCSAAVSTLRSATSRPSGRRRTGRQID